MKRKPDHVLAYFLAELGNEGSIDGNSRLMLKGRFVPKKIESVLRNYIGSFAKSALYAFAMLKSSF